MPSVCQSRLSEVHAKQSTRNGLTLSKLVGYGLVASWSGAGIHKQPTFTSDISADVERFLQQSDCLVCCMHCKASMSPD